MNNNIPQLRFSGFSDEWEDGLIRDKFDFISTNSLSRENLNYEKGSLKNIHYGDIHTLFRPLFDVTREKVPFINTDCIPNRITTNNYLQKGDILFADASEDYNEIGKCIEVINTNDEKIVAGLHTIHARAKNRNEFHSGFVAALLRTNSVHKQIRVIAQGIKVLSISPTSLGTVVLYRPKKNEQKKIADFLSAIDSRIESLEAMLDLQKKYKQGIMQRIFNQTLRFKDDNDNLFPDWQETTIGKISTSFSGGTPVSTNKSFYDGNIPFIKSGEISKLETEQFISENALNSSSAKMVSKGDLLLALYGATSGEVAIAKIDGAINQAVLCIRTAENKTFLYNWFSYNKMAILAVYLQGGQGNLSADIVKKLKISLPHKNEQKKIADFLSALDVKIEATQKQLNTARNWKKGLLQKMFV